MCFKTRWVPEIALAQTPGIHRQEGRLDESNSLQIVSSDGANNQTITPLESDLIKSPLRILAASNLEPLSQ